MIRAISRRQLTADIVLAAACLVLRFWIMWLQFRDVPWSIPTVIVIIGMAGTVAIHRLSPALALMLAWLTVIFQLSFLLAPDLSNAAILLVLFATSAYGSPLIKWLGLASAGVGAFIATAYVVALGFFSTNEISSLVYVLASNLARVTATFVAGFVASLALFVLCWALGLLARSLRTTQQSRAAQAAAEATRREAQRDVAIEQERNRIARDMHDVVAHSLAVVIAQADGARYAMRTDPASADDALITISTTAREALSDVRVLLGQLRYSQGQAPQRALADLDRLFDQLRSSGLLITRSDTGSPEPLGTTQQLAVYRIIQESLTNALRHGDTTHDVIVNFAWVNGFLDLTISSALKSVRPDQGKRGHGIDGMRERAVLAGGSLSVEEKNGRFVVTASIPAVATVPLMVVPGA